MSNTQSPLSGLNGAISQIVTPNTPRHQNVAKQMIEGGLLWGLIGYLIGARRDRKRQLKAYQAMCDSYYDN